MHVGEIVIGGKPRAVIIPDDRGSESETPPSDDGNFDIGGACTAGGAVVYKRSILIRADTLNPVGRVSVRAHNQEKAIRRGKSTVSVVRGANKSVQACAGCC